ncbi:TauD/TfdA dioxygenase family protein [Embleya sp. NPDC008237]|uniref:TauD/TfdA dioxygenase family protein n=1 Tax=Embleya sp. NPDC008237 TaxID=3363978 RepID=UPI0036E2493C
MPKIRPLTPTIGAEVSGLDLDRGYAEVDDAVIAELTAAFHRHKVLFFRGQEIDPARQRDFAARFGPLQRFPMGEPAAPGLDEVMVLATGGTAPAHHKADRWHSDATFLPCPPMGSMLRAIELPPVGGDTLWADMEAAYAALSPRFQALLEGLTAVHDHRRNPIHRATLDPDKHQPVEHPVVRTHPVTGRRGLFVNSTFTDRINGVGDREGAALLAFLLQHVERPEFQCRFRWAPGDIAMWDNRCTQHNAVFDYHEPRLMHRIVFEGDAPR